MNGCARVRRAFFVTRKAPMIGRFSTRYSMVLLRVISRGQAKLSAIDGERFPIRLKPERYVAMKRGIKWNRNELVMGGILPEIEEITKDHIRRIAIAEFSTQEKTVADFFEEPYREESRSHLDTFNVKTGFRVPSKRRCNAFMDKAVSFCLAQVSVSSLSSLGSRSWLTLEPHCLLYVHEQLDFPFFVQVLRCKR
nr:hypothetical protein Iba_chr08cCG0160 [Ipomoea batatas]